MIEARETLNGEVEIEDAPKKDENGKVEVSIALMKKLIKEDGMDNKQLAEYFDLSQTDIKEIRKHPALKGIRRATKRKTVIKYVLKEDLPVEKEEIEDTIGTTPNTSPEEAAGLDLSSDPDDSSLI